LDAPSAPGDEVAGGRTSHLADLERRIAARTATVAVVGLGYVGLPLLLAAAIEGFTVVGVDRDRAKIDGLRAGRSHIPDITDADLTEAGRGQFTSDPRVVVAADVVIVAVPTPLRDGTPDLALVRSAMEAVAAVLRPGQLVILESTTYPGTTEELVRPILESTGLVVGRDFALAYSPERINPGSGVTVRETPKIVAGVTESCGDVVERFYATVVDRVVRTRTPRAAEMAKLIENTFRQVNIALVNELATIAPSIGVDVWEALDAAATKPFGYLPFWPGPGVGGHCIAIDPSYLSWKVEQQLGFGIGFVEHARAVNNRMPSYVASRVGDALNDVGRSLRGARVLLLGLTYKPGVNDVRESPALAVMRRLWEAGAEISYHDPFLPEVVIGGQRHTDLIPMPPGTPVADLPRLYSEPLSGEVLSSSDCVVVLTAHPEIDYDEVVASAPLVFDAVGVTRARRVPNVVLL
jgi:UDP-N-acetyl-D-glucosamine dehydrogenase